MVLDILIGSRLQMSSLETCSGAHHQSKQWDLTSTLTSGLTRGIIAAVDVAFSPTPKQAGAIYEKNWNYAINYPNDGIILEGQKTF